MEHLPKLSIRVNHEISFPPWRQDMHLRIMQYTTKSCPFLPYNGGCLQFF